MDASVISNVIEGISVLLGGSAVLGSLAVWNRVGVHEERLHNIDERSASCQKHIHEKIDDNYDRLCEKLDALYEKVDILVNR
jgi:hypothetical protein